MAPTGPGTRTKGPVGARSRGWRAGGGQTHTHTHAHDTNAHKETSPGAGGGPRMPGAGVTPRERAGPWRGHCVPGHVPLANPIVRGLCICWGYGGALPPHPGTPLARCSTSPFPPPSPAPGTGTPQTPGRDLAGLWLGWRCSPPHTHTHPPRHAGWALGVSEGDWHHQLPPGLSPADPQTPSCAHPSSLPPSPRAPPSPPCVLSLCPPSLMPPA